MSTNSDVDIKIGIILPQDKITSVDLTLAPAGGTSDGDRITYRAHGDCVAGYADDGRVHTDGQPIVRIVSRDAAQKTVVHDCPAGRGFHWSRHIDTALSGLIEITSHNGYLFIVNELPLEQYLQGVITAEMSGDAPIEFLKAQCVVARSWTAVASERKHANLGIDLCNDDCCQRFQGLGAITNAARRAVEKTAGIVMTAPDPEIARRRVIVDANYSKSCGGVSESPEHVWSNRKPGQRSVVDAPPGTALHGLYPIADANMEEYLQQGSDAFCSPSVVPDGDLPKFLGRVDDGCGRFRWEVSYGPDEFADILRRKHFATFGDDGIDLQSVYDLVVTRRGFSGRAVEVKIVYINRDGRQVATIIEDQYNIRNALCDSFLYSSAFVVDIARDNAGEPTRFTFRGGGWGHGAGMCQIGALGMAINGFQYEQILRHYFDDIELTQLSSIERE